MKAIVLLLILGFILALASIDFSKNDTFSKNIRKYEEKIISVGEL